MNKKELLRKALQDQQALVNAAKNESRNFTEDEQRQFDELQGKIDELKRQIAEDDSSASTEVERQRTLEITSLCRDFNVDPTDYIRDGSSVEEVKSAILTNLRNSSAPVNARGTGEVHVTADAQDKKRAAMADALIMRGGVHLDNPADGAREFMGMHLRDVAIEALRMDGNSENLHTKSDDEIYHTALRQFFNPTAAFPSILDTAINKAYVEGYMHAPATFDRWTSKGTLTDFKVNEHNYLGGPAGEFLLVPEGGELKHDIPNDTMLPQRKLKTYGRQFTMTREAFINDDIGFLSTIPARYAASARKTINKQVYSVLVNNPAIYDGTNLFSSAHHNLIASGTGFTAAALQNMLFGLQLQEDQFGEAVVINPAYIIVPIGYSMDVYKVLNSPTINTTDNQQAVNPLFRYASQIEVIEDPTINVLAGSGNAMPWFLVGAKTDVNTVQVDYLNGQEIPTIRRMEKAGQLGFVWDIYLDWGITVMDYRGIVKNPGVVITNPLA